MASPQQVRAQIASGKVEPIYTIIGDEYYAATAYLSREPVLLGSLIGQDYGKILILLVILLGVLATIPGLDAVMGWYPKLFAASGS